MFKGVRINTYFYMVMMIL